MSYVLDALKKAEKDRRGQPELGLDNINQDDWTKPVEPRPFYLGLKILPFLLVFIVGLSALLWFVLQPDSVIESNSSVIHDQGHNFTVVDTEISVDQAQQINIGLSPEISQPESTPNPSLREIVSQLSFEGSLYLQSDPSASRVFINGEAFYTGDLIVDDVYLKDITLDSAILSNGYEEIIQSLR